jgi:hypothetical protein
MNNLIFKNMKIIKYIFIGTLVALMAGSCQKGLDPIESVNSKPDASAPGVVINYPVEGKPFVSPDSLATITFKVLATDDVELKSVVLILDGTEIASFTSFMDYRRLDLKYEYDNMLAGDHVLTVNVLDLTDKAATTTVNFSKITAPPYTPLAGEVLYFPLDGFNLELISGTEINFVGAPGYAEGQVNDCYQGATDSYMTYSSAGLTTGKEFSVAFWYKINAIPDRAGIIAISQPTDINATDVRFYGFRMFREISGADQNVGVNFGDGTAEVWLNPFVKLAPDADWVHIAISIATDTARAYINGVPAPLNPKIATTGMSWTGCDGLTVASGMPNFIYWLHFSDLSLYDEMHFFNRAISAEEVQGFYAVKK